MASARRVEVDHFIPWARYPDNGVHNLVATHAVCNGNKSDFLASAPHVQRWVERLRPGSESRAQLEQLATETAWEHSAERTFGVARGIYLRLPADIMLWHGVREFVKSEPAALARALAA